MKGQFVKLVESLNNAIPQNNKNAEISSNEVADISKVTTDLPITEGLDSIKQVIYTAYDKLNDMILKTRDGKGPRDFYNIFSQKFNKTNDNLNLYDPKSGDIFLKVGNGCLFMLDKGSFRESKQGILKQILIGNNADKDLKATYDPTSIIGVVDSILDQFDSTKTETLHKNLSDKFTKSKVKVDEKIIDELVTQITKEIIRVIFSEMKIDVIKGEDLVNLVKGLTLAISKDDNKLIDQIKTKIQASASQKTA